MLRHLPRLDEQVRLPRRAAGRLRVVIGLGIAFWCGMTVERHLQPPWTLVGWVRHLLAAPSCEAAERVGLAPAKQGTPGFWRQHDTNGNGIACEPDTLRARGYWLG